MSIKKGDIYIVPKKTLMAYLIDNNDQQIVQDQTIWVIESFDNGYITGTSYTMLNNVPFSKNKMVGSITPDNDVFINFYTSNSQTSGQGKLISNKKFLMQLGQITNLNNLVVGLIHWSYMIRINQCDDLYYRLPGVEISVPEFISKFD